MNRLKHTVVLAAVLSTITSYESVHAGVLREIVEHTGKAIARTVTGEVLESGAKSAAKQALKTAAQEAGENGAKRLASKGAGMLDDAVAKGGIGDKVANFAYRNKATIAGGTAIATMAANPETTIASGASMFNSSVDSAAKHVVCPAVSKVSSTFMSVLVFFTLGGVGVYLAFARKMRLCGTPSTWLLQQLQAIVNRVRTEKHRQS